MNVPHLQTTGPGVLRIDAHGLCDGAGFAAAPASVLVEGLAPGQIPPGGCRLRTLAVGKTIDVLAHEAARLPGTRVISRPDAILIPGLINAHTHLDLTHIGPRPHDPESGFIPWVEMIRTERHSDDALIESSVRQGVELSLVAGTVAVGDIAGAPAGRMSLTPWRTLRKTPLRGVSYLEFFGIGKTRATRAAGLEKLIGEVGEEAAGPHAIRLGLQPHAPTTVSRSLFALAARLVQMLPGAPICTHLAETPEERRFVGEGAGPQRELLERLGIWDESILDEVGNGQHPVEHLAEVLMEKRFAVAHVNDATDRAIEILAVAQTRVVYCPRASAYFGAERHFGPHRYREMLAAGVPVALGTDSVVNLPVEAGTAPSATNQTGRGMSILDEMRFLYDRDGTDPVTLLRMATLNGAVALGLDPTWFAFAPSHALAGLVAVAGVQGGQAGGGGLTTLLQKGNRAELLLF